MSELPILTRELAERIEALIAPEPRAPTEPQDPAVPVVARFGRTIASKATRGRPANKVFCFGHQDVAQLPEILAFYAVDNLEPSFFLAPMGFSAAVAAALTAAGFVPRAFQQAILYGHPRTAPPRLPAGVTVERVTATNLEQFVQTTAEGFEWPAQWRDAAMEAVRCRFRPEAYHFLARLQGDPAGVGSIDVRAEGAHLIDGAVVPRLRRKGIHLGLLQHRMHTAHRLGCSLVASGTRYGSASFRNQQRVGLRVAYIESAWGKG
jgi:GNAT superfamily N-acetyltransferase